MQLGNVDVPTLFLCGGHAQAWCGTTIDKQGHIKIVIPMTIEEDHDWSSTLSQMVKKALSDYVDQNSRIRSSLQSIMWIFKEGGLLIADVNFLIPFLLSGKRSAALEAKSKLHVQAEDILSLSDDEDGDEEEEDVDYAIDPIGDGSDVEIWLKYLHAWYILKYFRIFSISMYIMAYVFIFDNIVFFWQLLCFS